MKTSVAQTERAEADLQVRRTVEQLLSDIETRGDATVNEMSERFDG